MQYKIELFANNELRTTRQSSPYVGKKAVDGIARRERTRFAAAHDKYVYARRLALASTPVPTGRVSYVNENDGVQLSLLGSPVSLNPRIKCYPEYNNIVNALDRRPDGGFRVVAVDTDEALRQTSALVHIYKKSRQIKKHLGGWGVPSSERGFSRYARHTVLEVGACFDRLYPLSSTRMVTLTIPGSTDSALRAVADYSGWLIDRLFRPVRALKNSIGEPLVDWFFVWEFQGRGALHLHLCVASQSPKLTSQVADQITFDWFDLLLELKDKTGIDVFARYYGGSWRSSPSKWKYDNQVVKKSVAAYFAKYASKSVADEKREKTAKAYGMHFPSRFWGCSSHIKKVVKSYRVKVVVPELSKAQCELLHLYFHELLSETKPVSQREFSYCIEVPGMHQPVASGLVDVRYYSPDDFRWLHPGIEALLGTRLERKNNESVISALAQSALDNAPSFSMCVAA